MTDEAANADPNPSWHRQMAARLFNESWALLEQRSRTAAEDLDLLAAACASRWHWGQVGGAEEKTISDLHVSRVASALGLGDLAVRAARLGLAATEAAGFDDWRLATALETMARAYATASDVDERDRYVALAATAVEAINDTEDRELIASQLREVEGYAG